MQELRGNQLLHEFSLVDRSSTFQISEYNRLEEFERRTRSHLSQRLAEEDQELSLAIGLCSDMLVTHFTIELAGECPFGDLLQFLLVESACLHDLQQYKKMLNSNFKAATSRGGSCIVEAIAFSRSFKLTFLLKQQHLSAYMQQHSLKLQRSRTGFEASINSLMRTLLKKVQVWGYLPNSIPPAGHVTQLMNISHLMKKTSRDDQAAEADILLGLSLISARRFTQAVELLKKVSGGFLSRYEAGRASEAIAITYSTSKRDQTVIESNKTRAVDLDIFSFGWANGTSLLNNNKKNLLRAAKIELLIADATNHPSMAHDRIAAYHRAAAYSTGSATIDPQLKHYDLYTALLINSQPLMCFLIKSMYDRFEPVKIAAIKALEFVLESLGCSIGSYLPQLIKSIISTYPAHESQVNLQYNPLSCRLGMSLEEEQGKSLSSHNGKLVMDHHHHLLESILNLLPALSRNICRLLFQDVVLPNIFLIELSNEVRSYVLRIADKVIGMCLGDLDIQPAFVSSMLGACEGKGPLFPKDRNNSAMLFHFQRCWDTTKTKYLCRVRGAKLSRFTEWLNDTMVLFCEHELTNINVGSLEQILEIVRLLYQQDMPANCSYPIQPLLYFINFALNQPAMPFDKILVCLIAVLKAFVRDNGNSELVNDIIDKIIAKIAFDSLSVKQLAVLVQVASLCRRANEAWLERFLESVPHSTHDQTFIVLDELLRRCTDWMKQPLLTKIVNTLLDQYTVKGKAHKRTKELLIELLLKENGSELFLEICLVNNLEPSASDRQVNRFKIRHFDSKLYAKSCQLFSEKLTFAAELVRQLPFNQLRGLLDNGFIVRVSKALVRLSESKNSKNRMEATCLVRSLLDAYTQGRQRNDEEQLNIDQRDLLVAKCLLPILRAHLLQFKEAKVQANCLLMVSKIFQIVLPADKTFLKSYKGIQSSLPTEADLQSIDLNKELSIRSCDPIYLNLRVRQIIKMWAPLVGYLGSPWGFVRESCCQLLEDFASVDMCRYKSCYTDKMHQLLHPILTSLMTSSEHCDRVYGVRIYASAVGMNARYSDSVCIGLFRSRSIALKEQFTKIEELESDWCETVSKMASTIIQLGICKDMRTTVRRRNNSQKRSINHIISSSFFSFQLPEEGDFEIREETETLGNLSANIEHFLKETQAIAECSEICSEDRSNDEQFIRDPSFLNSPDDMLVYWLEKEPFSVIQQRLQEFQTKCCFYPADWHSSATAVEDALPQEQFGQPQNDIAGMKPQEIKDEELDFESLGIIEVDDEEWTDYEHEVRMVQKLPVKRKYKLSPNLTSPNTANPNKIDAMSHENEPKQEHEKQPFTKARPTAELQNLDVREPEIRPLNNEEKRDPDSFDNQLIPSDNTESEEEQDKEEDTEAHPTKKMRPLKKQLHQPLTKEDLKKPKPSATPKEKKKPSSANPTRAKKSGKKP